jgi:hypothetical protein
VAHSLGGLICGCLIQKVIPEQRGDANAPSAAEYVDQLCTYATPHGGIEFDLGFGLFEKVRDLLGSTVRTSSARNACGPTSRPVTPAGSRRAGILGSSVGARRGIPDGADLHPDRDQPGDYDVARGLSSRAVGAKSDGLVQIENAYVPGARFAFVHRSHSGRYGIVNSEEGYQNLRRFLLGDLEVTADLVDIRLPGDRGDDVIWQAEVELAVRGLPILMHQQIAAHHCPVILEMPTEDTDRPQPLVTTFLILDPSLRPRSAATSRYKLELRLLSLRQRRGIFDFGDHLEQTPDFDGTLLVDIGHRDGRLAAWAAWQADLTVPLRDYVPMGEPLADEHPAEGRWVKRIPLPARAREFLGNRAAVRLTVQDRQGPAALRPADT